MRGLRERGGAVLSTGIGSHCHLAVTVSHTSNVCTVMRITLSALAYPAHGMAVWSLVGVHPGGTPRMAAARSWQRLTTRAG